MSLASKIAERVARILPDRAEDPLRDGHDHIGRPHDRLDGHAKVTGGIRFAAEIALDGLVHAVPVLSTIAKGTIAEIDDAAALASPGVLAVITRASAPKMAAPPKFDPDGATDDAPGIGPILQTDEIYYDGQPIAVVVADTLDRASHAAGLVRVRYHEAPAQRSFAAAKASAARPASILGDDTRVARGDAEAALRDATCAVDHVYTTPRYNHNSIEPHAATARWDGDRLTVHDTTQYVRGTADMLAERFGIEPDAVHVSSPYVGGGFGGKGGWSYIVLCVAAAKVVQRPVRLVLSREQVFRTVGGRTLSEQRVALGARPDGALTSIIHTGVTANSTVNNWPEQFTFPARHLYASDTLLVDQAVARLNMVANFAMRAPGESIGTFALESAIDELAHALGVDPIELRLRNEPARDPVKGTAFSSRHLVDAYRLGAEKFGWTRAAPGTQRDGAWRVGQGVATAFYPMYRMPTAARVRISADGTAVVQTSAQDMGMGTSTAQTQHAAERLGLAMAQVRFEWGDSRLPAANQAGGSSQTVSVALAVQQAFEQVATQLLALARKTDSVLAGAKLDDVVARDGGLFLRDRPSEGERYAQLVGRAEAGFVEAEARTGQPVEMLKYAMHSYGAQFCEVRVHADTGEVRIARWLGVFDTGRIVNPKLARSQLRGGIIMGIGMALEEATLFDERSGRIMNPTLAEYHVPVHADIPELEVHFLDHPDPHTPMGARGIGEIGITGAAAAIANAVFHATGRRIRDLPITLDKLLER